MQVGRHLVVSEESECAMMCLVGLAMLVLRVAARSSEIHLGPGRARRAGKPCAVMAGVSSQS